MTTTIARLLATAAAIAAATTLPALAAGYDDQAPAAPMATPAATAPAPGAAAATPGPSTTLSYDGDKLRVPADYREWVYLTTGIDMSYNRVAPPGHHMFDSVFVDPASWQAFKRTGTWPEKTTFVLETRGARSKGSINKRGYYQDTGLMGLEVHVKDTARFGKDDGDGGWAFFSFEDTARPAAMIPRDADCTSCHQAHGAVDSTFVQFYPTALPLARAKGTLAAGYLRDLAQATAAD